MMDRSRASAVPFPVTFPPPASSVVAPVWTGSAFQIGDHETAILSYEIGQSGWTDQLTSFHEETAGADHYIDCASRRHTLEQLKRWLRSESPVIVDIGCSSGMMLDLLRREFPEGSLLGADYVRGPLDALAQSGIGVPLVQFDLTSCPLPGQSFDGIVLLNVLEHIERDDAALAHVARLLKPGGIAVIEVPAGPGLYDVYDKLLFHHRRYSMRELSAKILRSGLRILEKSHLGVFLYPAFWFVKKRGRRFLSADPQTQEAIVSRNIRSGKSHPLLHKIMTLEAAMRRSVYYPFGIRCLITCQKAP
jgi:SAM-dependent methyltransferase